MLSRQFKMVILLLGAVLLLVFFSCPAHAGMTRIERYNFYSRLFDNPYYFTNARGFDDIVQRWRPDNQGDYIDQTFNLKTNAYNVYMNGDTNIGVSNVVWNSGTGQLTSTVTAITGLNGLTDIHLEYSAVSEIGVSGGRYFLNTKFSSAGGVTDGYPYFWQMVLPGDWSVSGTGFGQHELLQVNPNWTIDKDFVFDGTNTTFLAHIDQYYYGDNINIDFTLHGGAVVPEPTTMLLLGSGLLGLAGYGRKKLFKK